MEQEIKEEVKAPEAEAPKAGGLDEIAKEVKERKAKPKKKKRRAGRPTLEEQKAKEAEEAEETAAESQILVSAIAGGFGIVCDVFAVPRWGPWWKLKEQEKQALGEACAAPLNKLLPSFFKSHPDEAKMFMVMFGIFAPRWERTRRVIEEMRQKEAEGAAEKPPPSVPSEPPPDTALTPEQVAHNLKVYGKQE